MLCVDNRSDGVMCVENPSDGVLCVDDLSGGVLCVDTPSDGVLCVDNLSDGMLCVDGGRGHERGCGRGWRLGRVFRVQCRFEGTTYGVTSGPP